MRKRTMTALAAIGLLVGGGSWSASTIAASAHTPQASVTCEAATVSLTSYDKHATAEVTLDGTSVYSGEFGGRLVATYPTTAGPDTHTLVVHVVSKDGARYNYDDTLTASGCAPVTPPTEEPTTPPTTPPTDVVVPRIQDYVTCDGGAFVLDNTESTVAVTYTVNGVAFEVPAGQAVHTDADGTLIQPTADLGGYTVTAGDRTWTFPAAGDCGTTVPTTPIAVTTPPVLTITPNNCVPGPDESVKIVTWDIPDGLAIGGVTGKGSAADEAAEILKASIGGTGGMNAIRSWILPITVLDGYTYDGPATITLTQATDAPNGDITKCETTPPPTEAPTTPPTGEPTTPAPSDGPTTEPTDSPTPTAGTTPPSSSPTEPSRGGHSPVSRSTLPSSAPSTASAVPVAADTSHGTLAYTGADGKTVVVVGVIAVALLALGGFILLKRRQTAARREE